jgi:peptide/nickel transport system substrate-binding protein
MTVRTTAKMILMLFCMISILTLSACGGTPSVQPQAAKESASAPAASVNKTISIGITNAPLMFNPIDNTGNTEHYITTMLFQPLVDLDESMKFVPMLADSIDTKDNQTYTVKLNVKAKWTDGKPVIADDLLFTVQMIGHPKSISSISNFFSILKGFDERGKLPLGSKDIEGVKKLDDHTVQFITKTPVDPSMFKEKIAKNLKTMPMHVLKDVDPEKFQQNPFVQKPDVSNGSFKFVSYQKDQYVELEANKDYFKGAPKINKLFFKIMPSANIVAQLQNSEIQMNYPGIGTINVQDFDKVKNMSNIRTISGKPFNYQMMAFNTKTIPDVRVRQAIAYAMNREMMVTNLLKGEGEIVDTQFTSNHPYANTNIKPYPYDPKKAQQLLQEAGWDFNKTLNLVVPSGIKTREQTADIIVENLKAVGIKAQITKYDLVTVVQKARKQDFDLVIIGYSFAIDPDVSNYFKTGVITNVSAYSNAEMDDLLQKGIDEPDPAKRRPIYDKVQELIERDLPQITLYSDFRLKAVSKKVKVGEPRDVGTLINVHEWDIEN